MIVEYAIEHQMEPGAPWHQVTDWSTEHPLKPGHKLSSDERIIRRLVINSQSF
ncbi:hypothetical protein TH728_02905 [Corynebacterium amycolatum]|uniref:hypothetical protein n=1 Tax=Corynebacterium amycolatum TaxID=43765 RepID=UPI002AACF009|nr:hypothetical protein [Corynebacterium amycolatum]MDY7341376.1 hypothetical protein [Corynebacterium amycolatum]